jgi:hypothetical protein
MFPFPVDSVKKGVLLSLQGALVVSSLAMALPASADAVIEWSAFADTLPMGPPPRQSRIKAMMYVAMHDALNSIDRRYETYTDVPDAAGGARVDAAVGRAAYRVLDSQVAGQGQAIAVFYNAWYATLPGCPNVSCARGVAAGDVAAEKILANRTGDGAGAADLPYTPAPGLGVYQPTPPAFAAPQFAGWAALKPFVIEYAAQFRAEPSALFDLTSATYTRDYNEVKRVGDTGAEARGDRTADQSAIAVFWPGGGANYNAVARIVLAERKLNVWQHAQLVALLNMAVSDSTVAVFDTKFTYNFWRPVTAIRYPFDDGNPATTPDEGWSSFQATPPYPDYTCGLPNNVGAAFAVMRGYFGTDDIAYTQTAAGITRSFSSLSQAGFEAVDARVFGGMHFRTGCVRGLIQGGQVGRYVLGHALAPLRKNGK